MKLTSFLSITLILCFSISMSAQQRLQLDSSTTTKSYNFSNYDTIEVSGDFDVDLNFSNGAESFELEANKNLMDYVEISQEGSTVRMKLKSFWNYKGKMILKVRMNTKMVDTYLLSGDAIVNVNDPIKSNKVEMSLKGDSILKAEVEAEDLNIMSKSDSVLTLSGEVSSLNAKLSSDSILKGKDLTSENVKIDLSGDSQAWVNVTSTLSAMASGDSILRYGGNPDVKKSVTKSDSEIRRMN